MSVFTSELTSSSISSSGQVDGLGRRVLAFDRETGAMLERLHLRPELAVFEQTLRERVEHLATLEDERFARPYTVERDSSTGELTVVAEFVAGCRLSDVLDTSYDAAIVPGVDVALGFMLEGLPALSMLHMVNGVTHGVIDPGRIVLTPSGQVVFLDVTFGSVVERLGLSRPRLWTEFGVASPPAPGPVRFDAPGDIAQVALAALMLVLGRGMRSDEYPDALPSLLMEVVEVAQIRGSTGFAGGLQRILQRSLPIPGRRPYTTADEAVVDVRQLVRREIGVDVCRQALVDFVAQLDAAFSNQRGDVGFAIHSSEHWYGSTLDSNRPIEPIPALEEFLEGASPEAPFETTYADTVASESHEEDAALDVDISLEIDPVVEDAPEAVYELPPLEHADLKSIEVTSQVDERSYTSPIEPEEPAQAAVQPMFEPPAPLIEEPVPLAAQPAPDVAPPLEPVPVLASTDDAADMSDVLEPPPVETLEPPATLTEKPLLTDGEFALAVGPAPDVISDGEPEPERLPGEDTATEEESESSRSSRRKKRQQQKSARARKDKLRSSTTEPKTPAPPPLTKEAPSARPAGPSGWLVTTPPEVPAFPTTQPTPVVRVPQPVFGPPNAPTPVYGAPSIAPPKLTPVVPAPTPQPVLAAPQPSSTPVRVKTEPPKGFAPKKTTIAEPVSDRPSSEPIAALPYVQRGPMFQNEEPRAFPWKLAAVAVVVAGLAILIGRSYLPGRQAVVGEPGAAQSAGPPTPAPPPPEPNDDAAIPAGKGRLIVRTEPAGVKVLLDQKPVGETPLRLETTAGRHVLTFVTSGGEVIRTVRVPSGKPLTIDVPVFSGWVAIFAPVVLEVATGGKTLGTTEQSRLMLPPGRHELTLTNRDLGYSAVEVVDIEPGEVKSVNLDPRGDANLNANPWAEVWLDGLKLGETPIANAKVPLGVREFLFKHPQHGERKVTATIRANAPAAISVDFTK